MKRINLFLAPIIAISFLASCTRTTTTTYTVILNASDGSSFSDGEKTLFLERVPKGKPLNKIKGYDLPVHDQLDFSYWYDEHGNTVAVNTPVTSDLFLRSKFYHGPEFERNYVYTTIYDELWNDVNNPIWNCAFSESQLKSFTDVTYESLFDKRLSTVETIDTFKKLYDFARYEMFTHRNDTIGDTKVIDVIFKNYQDTIREMLFLTIDKKKASLFANLSYADFVIKCYLATDDSHPTGITQYAYYELINLIFDLPHNPDVIDAWAYVIPKLLIASYYMGEKISDFAFLLRECKVTIQMLLDNKDYTNHDVKELAKVYGDFYLARSRDNGSKEFLETIVKYIVDNYFSKDNQIKLISNIDRQYLTAMASEMSNVASVSSVKSIVEKFTNRINKAWSSYNKHALRYYSIAMLLAEAIRKYPDGANDVASIVVDKFLMVISSEEESWEAKPYLYYIDSFAAVAEALSQFDPFIMLENGKNPSYEVYVENTDVILKIIKQVMESGKITDEEKAQEFAAIPALARHIAKISNYTIDVYDPNPSYFCKWVINSIINPDSLPGDVKHSHPMGLTTLLSVELDDAIVKCVVNGDRKKAEIDEYKALGIHGCYKFLMDRHSFKEYLSILPLSNELISKWYLCSCISTTLTWLETNDEFIAILNDLYAEIQTRISSKLQPFSYYLCFKTFVSAFNNKAIYRGRTKETQFDISRVYNVFEAISHFIREYLPHEKIKDSIEGMYNCVIKVLLYDYIPNITDNITEADRKELENRIDNKIQTLIENY